MDRPFDGARRDGPVPRADGSGAGAATSAPAPLCAAAARDRPTRRRAAVTCPSRSPRLDRSLRRIGRTTRIVAPRGCGRLLTRRGFRRVDEVDVGDKIGMGEARSPGDPGRPPDEAPAACTPLPFGRLRDRRKPPHRIPGRHRPVRRDGVSRGGDRCGAGAASGAGGRRSAPGISIPNARLSAMQMLRPRIAIPIHWGTLAPITLLAAAGLPRLARP